ncbi:FAD-dependent monooxygenase [Herbidospora sp. NBRC 101105]|uniref:FAD-dependent monooxygenase n=1 Tax=Herbidospora sp. NBRC 101105 TaxID=3032195 RepID=UPI0024A32694|nr:FAD-dependent monooxygenase [Herbidospora sp. NBRC 101105]GLX95943.1 FAD-dependent oxidoreductase [Herbidospora sp. NBRC 101105]
MRILISGASVAGPLAAYWLARRGHAVTVVEKAPELRKAGGHAVDLFRPALEIARRMGVYDRITARRTGVELLSFRRPGDTRPARIRIGALTARAAGDHVEIMRDDLSEILYEAGRDHVEYVFGDSIAAIDDRVVTFENGPAREFDLVIGADGLHSNVRRLAFGPESDYATWIGAHLAVLTVTDHPGPPGRVDGVVAVDRMAMIYHDHTNTRGFFMFRTPAPLDYHHRDVPKQKSLLKEHFDDLGGEAAWLLDRLGDTPAFYFDSVTQLRMDTWSKGRVTLVGDAGYCPGPAVGGSTSLAMVGAYVLAGELARFPDHGHAFASYERELADYVQKSRAFAIGAARRLVPGNERALRTLMYGTRLLNRLPTPAVRLLTASSVGLRVHTSFRLRDYPG